MAATGSIIDVYVKLTSGEVINFPVSPDTQIRAICEKVAEKEAVPSKCVVLKHTGKILKKRHTVGYLGVRQETILKTEIQPVKSLTVIIQKDDDTTMTLTIDNLTTIAEILRKIQDKNASVQTHGRQHLKFNGHQLTSLDDTAQDCGIGDESVLKLTEDVTTQASAAAEEPEELDEETKQELLNSFAAGLSSDKTVEVVFSFDTTGSMYSYLTQVRDRLQETVKRLLRDIPNIRIGIIAHGDYCDQTRSYVLRQTDITADMDQLVDFVNNVPRSGGEGNSACYEWVLKKSQDLAWSEDAAKALVILGDVVPHGMGYTDQRINWHDELDKLCHRGIKVYGVQVKDYTPATDFYQFLAETSGGAYIKFQHFDLITDMFLAVCYRETGDDQLQAYCDEVATEGRMTEELTTVFKQLKEKPSSSTSTKTDVNDANDDGDNEDAHKEKQDDKTRPARTILNPAILDKNNLRYIYKESSNVWSFQYQNEGIATRAIVSVNLKTKSASGSKVRQSFRRLKKWGQGIVKKD